MPKSDFVPSNDGAFGANLNTFKNNIGPYAATFGLSAPTIAAQAADADYFGYALACHNIARVSAQEWSRWKEITRYGGTPPSTGMPAAPTFPAAVPPVDPGIEPRFRALVKQIKAHAAYNSAIGEALGIEGPEQSGPNMATIQPAITAKTQGNTVLVGWDWGGQRAFLDICEIQVDRGGGGGFVLLSYDTTPNYTDTAPFPATPVKWTYRAIYRVGDHAVGQWSNPVSLTVGG